MEKSEIWKPKVLILGPGGVKGFLTIGSLLFLEKSKILKEINKIVGISIGAVIGLFYTAGFSMTEILEIALSTQLADVMTSLDIVNVMKKNGLVSHDILRKKMEEKLIQKYGFVPSLKQFYLMTGLEFEVVVTNLDEDKAEYFSHLTEPDLSCVEAVLMSISLPIFFQSYIYKNKFYLDGGVADPFPIERYRGEETFGIFLKGSPKDSKNSFFDYLSRIVQVITSVQIKNMKIPPKCKILNLQYNVNDTIGMKMSFEQRVDLVLVGYVKAFEFYQELYRKDPKNYPLFISKYHSIRLFDPFIPKEQEPNQLLYEYESNIESEQMEEEGDHYLQHCFDSEELEESSWESEEEENCENQEQEEEEQEDEREEEHEEQEDQKNTQENVDISDNIYDEDKDIISKELIQDVQKIKEQMNELINIENQILTSPKRNKYVLDEDEPLEILNFEEELIKVEREEDDKEQKEEQQSKEHKEDYYEPEHNEKRLDNSEEINMKIQIPEENLSSEGKVDKKKESDPFSYITKHKKKKKKGKRKHHTTPEWIKK